MNTKIKFLSSGYVQEKRTKEGYLISSESINKNELSTQMQQLAKDAEPSESETLLSMLRVAYRLFKPASVEFQENIK
jgi:hypothetical protein